MPKCWEARRLLSEAHAILAPHVAKREALLASGETPPEDGLEWMRHVPNPEAWDPATFQVSLALNAIHTTTDLLVTTMSQIARHDELFGPMREEVIRALTTHGLTKAALGDMKLMDSVMKESQRLKPMLLGRCIYFYLMMPHYGEDDDAKGIMCSNCRRVSALGCKGLHALHGAYHSPWASCYRGYAPHGSGLW